MERLSITAESYASTPFIYHAEIDKKFLR